MTTTRQTDEVFFAGAPAAGPLVFTFVLSSTGSIVTTVTGDARQFATVAIVNSSIALWSATLTQFDPTATIPFDVVGGSLTINKGGTFTLQVPSALQPGSMTASLTLVTPNNPQGTPFAAQVATWSLTS
jgi:hypothetical protein